MQSDRGFLSPYFITNAEKMVAEARGRPHPHPREETLLAPAAADLEAAVQTAKPLLLVAEDIERRRHRSGGGAALLRAQAAVGKLKDDNPDIQAGINIVLTALEAPSHHTPRSTTSAASRNAGIGGCEPCCTRPPTSC